MGYSEVECALCLGSFNIGRIRRADEPPSAGWMVTGDGRWFVDAGRDSNCTDENGCRFAIRKTGFAENWETYQHSRVELPPVEGEDEGDSDYVYDSPVEDEQYEFESDDDLVDQLENDVDIPVPMSDQGPIDDEQHETFSLLVTEPAGKAKENPSDQDRLISTKTVLDHLSKDDGIRLQRGTFAYEHIAGLQCRHRRGYNGHYVTVEEMRGINTFQCLVHKRIGQREWIPEPDDQDFEQDSDYFLTGVSDYMPSCDLGRPVVIPPRHGVESPETNITWNGGSYDAAVPFHPYCFDIYMRLSRKQFGYVDVNGLMDWAYGSPYERPTHPDVKRSADNMWEHHRGLEYLSANPLFIPKLRAILRSAVDNSHSFSTRAGAFILKDEEVAADDIFSSLPQEMKSLILSHLGSKDIASLRLASRSFRQLPIFLWRELLVKELPSLWEVHGDGIPPYVWASVSVEALNKEAEEKGKLQEEFAFYHNIIQQEIPELLGMWKNAEEQILDSRPNLIAAMYKEDMEDFVCKLPANTNWHRLYLEIRRHWKDLKGLKNRERIWARIEDIIEAIPRYRRDPQQGTKHI